jgi:Spermine/spermidine synthase domain
MINSLTPEPQSSPSKQPGTATYVGIFFVALSVLMYEILLTRIFSVTMLYHFAFAALSLAMFGMTAGALVVYLAPRLFPPERIHDRLAMSAIAFPIALLWSFLTELIIPFRMDTSLVAIYALAFTCVVIAVPFIISGITVCLVLTGFPRAVSGLYAADLAGAALGCVLLIAVLDRTDGPTAVLWVAALAAGGALAFSKQASSQRVRTAAAGTAVLLVVIAVGHTALLWQGFPLLRIVWAKGRVEAIALYESWNSHSRVRVYGNPLVEMPALGWGLSQKVPAMQLSQLYLDIDNCAATVMTRYNGDPASVEHLKYDVTNIAYYLRPDPDVLVIGAGGGRDVLSALVFGSHSVTAVDINKNIIDTVNRHFGDYTGHLDRDPRVRFVNDEARSFVARANERFGLIQISLIDTWAATAAGAFVLSENSLYTVEAWTTFLRHLKDDGLLSVSRWYFHQRPVELYRTTTLAVEALRSIGISDPRRHIVIVRIMRPFTNSAVDGPEGVGTIVVSRRPFTDPELDTIEAEAGRLGFEIPFGPRGSLDPTFERLTDPNGSAAFVAGFPINIKAPTDNSPFFFNMLRLRDILRPSLQYLGTLTFNMRAVVTLGALLIIVSGLTAVCILLPLWLTRDRVVLTGAGPLFAFFLAIGLGFMLIETSQMQRLIISLGHPTYGLSVVLFALLLSSGLGSYLTDGIAPGRISAAGRQRLILLVVILAVFGAATPAIARWSEPMTTPIRILAAVVLLFPVGLFMGMAFPLGMKVAAARSRTLTPWFWGLNGAASVLASVLSVCIALTWSISTAFWTGWTCYLIALLAFVRAANRGPHAAN